MREKGTKFDKCVSGNTTRSNKEGKTMDTINKRGANINSNNS